MGLHDLPTLADRGRCAPPKPVRGTGRLEKQASRKAIDKQEDRNKAVSKKRDGGRCRLPFCPWCVLVRNQGHPQSAHVIEAKGMGGDAALEVSQPEHLMTLCPLSHAAQEKHEWAVEPLTDAGTNDVCAFYILQDRYDANTSERTVERVLWAREKAIGKPDAPRPYTKWQPIRAPKERD